MKLSSLKPKRIDGYIIRTFLGTFAFAISMMIAITVVFDINEKLDQFMKPEVTVRAIAFEYYLNFIPYFINLFSPLFTFITVIFFTSRLADRSEIIALLAGGISFRRLMMPYLAAAAIIAAASFALSSFIIPPANITRIEFQNTYIRNKKVEYAQHIQLEASPGVFAFFDSFNAPESMGYRFSLDHFDGKKLVSRLTAGSIKHDSLHHWTIYDYMIRDFDGMREHITLGSSKDTVLAFTPSDFLIAATDAETMTTPQLSRHIARQKARGMADTQFFEIEYHTRFANVASFFILTIIGLTLSSRKIKGGMGKNIGIGLLLSFSYILFTKITSTFAISGEVSPMIAAWIPNVVYAGITVYLYRRAPR